MKEKRMRKSLLLCLAACCVAFTGLVAYAGTTHEGKVVSVEEGTGNSDGKLVMTDKDGKDEHRHSISSEVRITRDNKTVKLNELKKGDMITVTTNSNGKVTEVAANQSDSNRDSDRNSNQNANRNNSGQSNAGQDNSNRHTGRGGDEIPDFLTNLNLTSEQKEKIKSVCNSCEKDRENAWHQFHRAYREAIGIEASMLAAIEENLSESQRKQIRDQRQRISRKQGSGNQNDSSTNQSSRSDNSRSNSDQNRSNNDQNNQSAQNDRNQTTRNNQSGRNDSGNQNTGVYEEITIVTLTPEQEETAEGVRGSYSQRLHKLNHKISELHAQLVAMEVDRLIKIEDILTKEQRQQLRKEHQGLERSNVRTSQNSGGTD